MQVPVLKLQQHILGADTEFFPAYNALPHRLDPRTLLSALNQLPFSGCHLAIGQIHIPLRNNMPPRLRSRLEQDLGQRWLHSRKALVPVPDRFACTEKGE